MLASFWLYLRGRYLASGVSVGLSALAKLSGALTLPAILLHWLLTKRAGALQFVITMLSAYATFLLLMPLFEYVIFRQLTNPIGRIYSMLTLSGSLTFASTNSANASHPWDWILRPEIMAYWYDPHYIGVISFTIWALIIPSVLYIGFKAAKGSTAGIFGISWFASTYLFWIPVSLITDRISFVYYFYPTVGAICLGLGLGLSKLLVIWETRKAGKLRWVVILAVTAYLLLHIAIFVILSPAFNVPLLFYP
jgi:predicted membrane-bound dolichyl-phosphate-mannose-protein mannosyltransferase